MDVDGFASEEVDFAVRLAASPPSVKDEFDTKIMSPLVNGVDGATLLITGNADRVDTGEGHRSWLRREGTISFARADSAEDAVLAMFGDWLDPAPASWEELPQIAVYKEARGAVALVSDGGDEDARRRNRRVAFQVFRFVPEE